MAVSSESEKEELDTSKKTRYITFNLTPFQYAQIEELVKIGVSRKPTTFCKEATLERINSFKDLLPSGKIPPRFRKDRMKDSKTKSIS